MTQRPGEAPERPKKNEASEITRLRRDVFGAKDRLFEERVA